MIKRKIQHFKHNARVKSKTEPLHIRDKYLAISIQTFGSVSALTNHTVNEISISKRFI